MFAVKSQINSSKKMLMNLHVKPASCLFFYPSYSLSLSKTDVYITHDATWPPQFGLSSECIILSAANVAWSRDEGDLQNLSFFFLTSDSTCTAPCTSTEMLHNLFTFVSVQQTHKQSSMSELSLWSTEITLHSADLVDRLSHVVLFHGNVITNQLLHRCAQQAVFQQLLHVLLMLCVFKHGGENTHFQLHTSLQSHFNLKKKKKKKITHEATLRDALSVPNFKVGHHAAT